MELGDEDMIDEVDELVEKFTRTTIYAPKPISTAREEGKDEERLIDIGSSDIQTRLNQAVSPLLQFEPYKDHPDDAASSNSFGLKAQPSSVVQLPRSPYAIYSSSPSPRLNVPAHLLQPNPPDALQSTVMQSWSDTEPSPTTKRYTAKFLERLSDVINSRLGEKGSRRFKVDLFGSVSWGGTTGQGGDVDMVLLVSRFSMRRLRSYGAVRIEVYRRDVRHSGRILNRIC